MKYQPVCMCGERSLPLLLDHPDGVHLCPIPHFYQMSFVESSRFHMSIDDVVQHLQVLQKQVVHVVDEAKGNFWTWGQLD